MASHTPGPWYFEECHPAMVPVFQIWNHARRYVAYLSRKPTPGEVEANAKLISAAPDLLAALQACVERAGECECEQDEDCPICDALAAIAKALGT